MKLSRTQKNRLLKVNEIINVLKIVAPIDTEKRRMDCVKQFSQKQYDGKVQYTGEWMVKFYFKENPVIVEYYVEDDEDDDEVKKPTPLASANSLTNTIRIYDSLYSECHRFFGYRSAYPKEDEFQQKHVKTNKQFLAWVITHEYVHLLHPELNHTKVFFSKVEKLYIKYQAYINK